MGQNFIKGDFVMTPQGWVGKVNEVRVNGELNYAYVMTEQKVEHIFYIRDLRLVSHGPGIPSDDAEYREILAAQEIMDKLQP